MCTTEWGYCRGTRQLAAIQSPKPKFFNYHGISVHYDEGPLPMEIFFKNIGNYEEVFGDGDDDTKWRRVRFSVTVNAHRSSGIQDCFQWRCRALDVFDGYDDNFADNFINELSKFIEYEDYLDPQVVRMVCFESCGIWLIN